VIVPKFVVPDDTDPAAHPDVQERLQVAPTRVAPPVVSESKQVRSALSTELFAEAMLENSPTRPQRPVADFVVSGIVQVLLLAVLLVVPLYFSEALDTHQLSPTLLAPPPPAAPPPPPAASRSITPKRKALSVAGRLVVPRVVPHQVARLSEEPDGSDLVAATVPGDGVPGGIPGGQPGGVIGGVLSGAAPPPPAPVSSAPKVPIRVGGQVKRPRLISGPSPVYPVLARQAKISGDVLIEAVIDTQGNVVEMRTVSGHPLLAFAAMEALRHWKYEPTILGGEPIPVRLLVTIMFDGKNRQG
jgi:periplasmic protein TonB